MISAGEKITLFIDNYQTNLTPEDLSVTTVFYENGKEDQGTIIDKSTSVTFIVNEENNAAN